jgi:hypothetical protein
LERGGMKSNQGESCLIVPGRVRILFATALLNARAGDQWSPVGEAAGFPSYAHGKSQGAKMPAWEANGFPYRTNVSTSLSTRKCHRLGAPASRANPE